LRCGTKGFDSDSYSDSSEDRGDRKVKAYGVDNLSFSASGHYEDIIVVTVEEKETKHDDRHGDVISHSRHSSSSSSSSGSSLGQRHAGLPTPDYDKVTPF
jgi:hypothetical protein